MNENKLTLSKIGILLAKGKINNEQAEILIQNIKKKNKTVKPKSNVHLKDNCLYYSEEGETKAYLQFYNDRDCFGNPFIMIDKTESYEQGKGYFSLLLDKLEDIAKKKEFLHLTLEVDYHNTHAISVYESKGFYSLGPLETLAENTDRIIMRKDISEF
jgi:hypothetical protein